MFNCEFDDCDFSSEKHSRMANHENIFHKLSTRIEGVEYSRIGKMFQCECLKTFERSDSFRRHKKTCSMININICDDYTYIRICELIPGIRFAVCEFHREVVGTNNLLNHLKSIHLEEDTSNMRKGVKNLEVAGVWATSTPFVQPQTMARHQLLEPQIVYECHICCEIFMSARKFINHQKRDSSCSTTTLPLGIECQKVHKKWVRIDPLTYNTDAAARPFSESDVNVMNYAIRTCAEATQNFNSVDMKDRQGEWLQICQFPQTLGTEIDFVLIKGQVGEELSVNEKKLERRCREIFNEVDSLGYLYPSGEARKWLKSVSGPEKATSFMKNIATVDQQKLYATTLCRFILYVQKTGEDEMLALADQLVEADEDVECKVVISKVCALFELVLDENPLTGSGYDSSILLTFAAKMGVDTTNNTFYEPSRYSHVATKLLYLCRLAIILMCYVNDPEDKTAYVKSLRNKWLVEEADKPGSVLGLFAKYTIACARAKNGRQALLIHDDDTFTFGIGTHSKGELLNWINSNIEQLHEILVKDLLFNAITPITANDISEKSCEFNNSYAGYNIAQIFNAEENTCKIIKSILSFQNLKSRFIDETGNFIKNELVKYEKSFQKWLEILLVVCITTMGQPPRMTEVLDMMYRNDIGKLRSILVTKGRIMWQAHYNKTGYGKCILRFSNSKLTEAFTSLICLIQPFRCIISDQLGKLRPSTYIFSQLGSTKFWSADTARSLFKENSKKYLRTPIGIRDYRQWACGVAQAYLAPSNNNNRLLLWEDGDEEDEEASETFIDAQAGHSSAIAQQCYGRGNTFSRNFTTLTLHSYEKISDLWQDYLQVSNSTTTRKLRLNNNTNTRGSDVHLKSYNLDFYNEGQQSCCEAIYEEQNAVTFCILPTGSGKSFLYQLSATVYPYTLSIVMLPFVALTEDAIKHCNDKNIKSCRWVDALCEYQDINIIFISAEKIVESETLNWISTNGHRVEYVFIDEAHVLIQDRDWRTIMQKMHLLRHVGVKLVFLSATLPPSELGEICDLLHVKNPKVLRREGRRRNIKYVVSSVASTLCNQRIYEKVNAISCGKIIVFCMTRLQAEECAQILNCKYYHAGMTDEERSAVFNDWKNESAIDRAMPICATSALGAGVDLPDVRLVLLPFGAKSVLDLSQQAGRAGRDGEYACAEVWADSSPDPTLSEIYDKRVCIRQLFGKYIDGLIVNSCRKSSQDVQCNVCESESYAASTSRDIELYNMGARQELVENDDNNCIVDMGQLSVVWGIIETLVESDCCMICEHGLNLPVPCFNHRMDRCMVYSKNELDALTKWFIPEKLLQSSCRACLFPRDLCRNALTCVAKNNKAGIKLLYVCLWTNSRTQRYPLISKDDDVRNLEANLCTVERERLDRRQLSHIMSFIYMTVSNLGVPSSNETVSVCDYPNADTQDFCDTEDYSNVGTGDADVVETAVCERPAKIQRVMRGDDILLNLRNIIVNFNETSLCVIHEWLQEENSDYHSTLACRLMNYKKYTDCLKWCKETAVCPFDGDICSKCGVHKDLCLSAEDSCQSDEKVGSIMCRMFASPDLCEVFKQSDPEAPGHRQQSSTLAKWCSKQYQGTDASKFDRNITNFIWALCKLEGML